MGFLIKYVLSYKIRFPFQIINKYVSGDMHLSVLYLPFCTHVEMGAYTGTSVGNIYMLHSMKM